MLQSLIKKRQRGHERTKYKGTSKTSTTAREYPPPVPLPIPSYKLTNPHLSHNPIIYNNNTMDIEFMVQIRQSNKCRRVRFGEVFHLHLGSGVGPWVSIPCLPQDTSHIYWFHPLKQSGKSQEPKYEIELLANHIVLLWPMYTEPRIKGRRFGTQS